MAEPASPNAPLLQMRGITKSFLGTVVLDQVDLDCRAGEVHAVVGENGAGKSTLIKVLAGVHPPDAGQVVIAGEDRTFHHPVEAQAAGVATIYQEFNLLPERTVAENVWVGREPARWGVVDRARMAADTQRLLDDLGERSLSPRSRVGDLSVAQQQVVEVVKARSLDARILVMDEPTAALGDWDPARAADLLASLGLGAELREALAPVGDYAASRGVRLGVEPLNRYETSVVNTVAQGLEMLDGLPAEAVGLTLDIYHLNIEEQDPAGAIRLAGAAGRVAHVQVCANDRGAPGADHMDWHGIRDALTDVGYDGALCIESFTAENESIATAASIWRPLARSQDAIATDGLAFLRELWA